MSALTDFLTQVSESVQSTDVACDRDCRCLALVDRTPVELSDSVEEFGICCGMIVLLMTCAASRHHVCDLAALIATLRVGPVPGTRAIRARLASAATWSHSRQFHGGTESAGLNHALDVARVIDLRHHDPDLTLASVALEVGLSTGYAGRLVKRTFGVTFRGLLCSKRIRHAKTLLSITRSSVKEVSWQSGFPTAADFSRHFRQATGKTPSEFRTYTARVGHVPDLTEHDQMPATSR